MKALILSLMTLIATASAPARADMPSTHGMLVFGDKQLYASHLPMFHAPHDYQVLLKLKFEPSTLTERHYIGAKQSGKTLFTIEPERFDLTTVIDGKRTSFKAKLYDGHFERGGKNLGSATFIVEKVIFSSKLDPAADPNLTPGYFVFGQGGEYFAAHLIQGKPSFDAIVSVTQPVEFKEAHCQRRFCPDPVVKPVPDSKLPLTLPTIIVDTQKLPVDGDALGDVFGASSSVLKVIYVEESDLAH